MFKAWIDRMGYSQREAAEALGVSLGKINTLAKGEEPGLLIQLACEALERRRDKGTIMPAPDGGLYVHAQQGTPTSDELNAIRERLAALEEQSPASVEARLNAIEQRLLPEAVRDVVLRWHATWLARQPLPAATISKANKLRQADDMTEEEEELEALKARARASFPSEDDIQRQISQTMRDRQEAQAREKAENLQEEELAMIARRAARSVNPE